MAQVKKAEIREVILDAALELFEEHGYSETTMRAIAHRANISTSNIYNYFASKLEILFEIYDPWLKERLNRLERDLAGIHEPDEKLRMIFRTLWVAIPAEHNGFANNLLQALSTATREEGYDRGLLEWCEAKVTRLVESAIGEDARARTDTAALAHIVFMAFDGFTLNHWLGGPELGMERYIDTFVLLLRPRR
jgi:AcrR family transcriptional regulator